MLKRPIVFILAAVVLFVLVCTLDIIREGPPWDPVDVVLDILQTLGSVLLVIAVAWAMQRMTALREDQIALRDYVARNNAKGADWRAARSAEIAALSDAIALEFRDWGLTGEEMDVAELLLKGASLKEIALDQRQSMSRLQALEASVYRKAGLSGRVELSAYFLDSMFEALPAPVARDRALS